MNEQELTHAEPLLDSVDLVHIDRRYSGRSGCYNPNSDYEFLPLEGMADAASFVSQR